MWPKRFPGPSHGRVPGRGSRTRSPAATIVLGMKTRRTFSNGCHAISSRPTSSSGSTALGPPPWPPSVRPPTVFAALIAQPPGACSDLYATVHVASSLTNWLKRQFLAHTGAETNIKSWAINKLSGIFKKSRGPVAALDSRGSTQLQGPFPGIFHAPSGVIFHALSGVISPVEFEAQPSLALPPRQSVFSPRPIPIHSCHASSTPQDRPRPSAPSSGPCPRSPPRPTSRRARPTCPGLVPRPSPTAQSRPPSMPPYVGIGICMQHGFM